MAEGVFRHLAAQANLVKRVGVDSAGTGPRHIGVPPDPRAINAARDRGYDLTPLRARQLDASELSCFDLLLAMDQGHFDHLVARSEPNIRDRIHLFLAPVPGVGRDDVPDPYYGDAKDYEYALDLIEKGARVWLAELQDRFGVS